MHKQDLLIGIKKPGMALELKNVSNELETLQEIVGGYVEQVRLNHWVDNLALVCNEEGKIFGLQPNFTVGADIIVGTAVFLNLRNAQNEDDGNWHGLNEEQVDHLKLGFAEYESSELRKDT